MLRLRNLNGNISPLSVSIDDVLHIKFSKSGIDLDRFMEDAHRVPFDRVQQIPGWKIKVVCEDPSLLSQHSGGIVLHVGWFFSHVIGVGMSGVAFHRAFLDSLNDNGSHSLSGRNNNVLIDEIELTHVALLPPMKDSVSLQVSWLFMLKLLFHHFIYSPHDILA